MSAEHEGALPLEQAPEDEGMRKRLSVLAATPPQTLLIEGGTEQRRLGLALYWAMAAKCPQALEGRENFAAPCQACAVCRQLQANENTDLHILDGRIGNRQDEEAPGPIKALRMENVRELKTTVSAAPRGPGSRVVILQGMQLTREEALNCLLKTLEEPAPHTLFVLLAPQREQLLPTLVSRSMCVTLPWISRDTGSRELEDEMAVFLRTGAGAFIERIAARGALDAESASQLILGCLRALSRAQVAAGSSALEKSLQPLAANAQNWAVAGKWLAEAQQMIQAAVAPHRVIMALAGRLLMLTRSA